LGLWRANRGCCKPDGENTIDDGLIWYLIMGVLLISMALAASMLQRFPISPAMFYLPVGFVLGPAVFGLIHISVIHQAPLLTEAARIAVLVSLFSVGLKLRVGLRDNIWFLPLRLGVLAMLLTIALLTAGGFYFLKLPLGAAILLAAILAPTDPVLASDVQIKNIGDRDQIRFGLTGEGGLNDGTTFPFVMLGLAMLGVDQAREYLGMEGLLRLLWGIAVAPLCGWVLGWSVGRLVVQLRKRYKLAIGMEEFLAIGLIALSYGLAEELHGIGFLAVFAAGIGMRQIEAMQRVKTNDEVSRNADGIALDGLNDDSRHASPSPHLTKMEGDVEAVSASEEKAPAYMTATVLGFNQQIENFAEFLMVMLLGILISESGLSWEGVLVAVVLFFIIRPLSVAISLAGAGVSPLQRRLMAWFGIRGIGTLYYLLFALQYQWEVHGARIGHGSSMTHRLISVVLTVLAMSVVLHGISSTPLMEMYYRRKNRR
jgi:sodium/hydrogen antiporter